MNSSIACRYPRFDSGERRLSRTADLLWSRSGRPSFVFGRFSFEDFRLACLLIPAASNAAGQEPMTARRRVGRFTSSWHDVPSPDAGRLVASNLLHAAFSTMTVGHPGIGDPVHAKPYFRQLRPLPN